MIDEIQGDDKCDDKKVPENSGSVTISLIWI